MENHYDDRAIRGRITVYVIKRESANGLILVDKSTDTQLIDVGSKMLLKASCAKDLPFGFYSARVRLQWQYVNEDKVTGTWFTLAAPQPFGAGNAGNNSQEKSKTDHLFAITPCDPNLPDDANEIK